MAKFKAFVTAFLAMLLCVICIGTTVWGSSTETTAALTKDDAIAYSGTISAKQCKYRGSNNSSSKYQVYVIAKYKVAGVLVTDVKYLMDIGETTDYNTTSKFGSSYTWELALNPKD